MPLTIDFDGNFDELEARMRKRLEALPDILGSEAVNFFVDRFNDEAWLDGGRQPWPIA